MAVAITDEQLDAWDGVLSEGGTLYPHEAGALIQEVRRLREAGKLPVGDYMRILEERAETAEAEVEEMRESAYYLSGRKLIQEAVERAEKAEAERDRYKAMVESTGTASRNAIKDAALDQQEKS